MMIICSKLQRPILIIPRVEEVGSNLKSSGPNEFSVDFELDHS